jgi:hypothetical protein
VLFEVCGIGSGPTQFRDSVPYFVVRHSEFALRHRRVKYLFICSLRRVLLNVMYIPRYLLYKMLKFTFYGMKLFVVMMKPSGAQWDRDASPARAQFRFSISISHFEDSGHRSAVADGRGSRRTL